MKKLILISLIFTAFCSCSENEETQQILGSWCLSEKVSILKVTFSSNKIFKTEFSFTDQLVLDHGTWTVRDDELLTRIQKGDEVHEDVYYIDFENDKMYMNKIEEKSSEYNPIFSYSSFFAKGRNEGEIALTRCEDQ